MSRSNRCPNCEAFETLREPGAAVALPDGLIEPALEGLEIWFSTLQASRS